MKKNFVEILEQALDRPLSLSEAEQLFKYDECTEGLLEAARKVAEKRAPRGLKVYIPSRLFPSVSITGGRCELDCAHCNAHYLSHMIPAETPEKLYHICLSLYEQGAVGCLISGGSTREGYVPLEPFVETIKRVKEDTDLILNLHTGLISMSLAWRLAKANVDIISLDVVGDTETVRTIYGINKRAEDYFEALANHVNAGLRHVIPHICIGLHYGAVKGELKALDAVRKINPESLVFIVFNPTKGTRMERTSPPAPLTVAKVIAIARLMLRDVTILLGCMRPSGKRREEIDMLSLNIIDGIVLPTRKIVNEAKKRGFSVKKLYSCCAVPLEYEPLVEAKQTLLSKGSS